MYHDRIRTSIRTRCVQTFLLASVPHLHGCVHVQLLLVLGGASAPLTFPLSFEMFPSWQIFPDFPSILVSARLVETQPEN